MSGNALTEAARLWASALGLPNALASIITTPQQPLAGVETPGHALEMMQIAGAGPTPQTIQNLTINAQNVEIHGENMSGFVKSEITNPDDLSTNVTVNNNVNRTP